MKAERKEEIREWVNKEDITYSSVSSLDVRELLAELDEAERRSEWQICESHGRQDGKAVWGCPECVRELIAENRRARGVVEAARPFASSNYPDMWTALKRYDEAAK